jgi:hypothetical protein
MSEYLSVVTDASDQALDATKRVQEFAIETLSSISEAVEPYVPELREYIPFADNLPSPKQLVSAYFDLAEKWMKSQRDYSIGLLEAIAPVTDKVLPGAKTRKTGSKSAAKKVA